MIRAQQNFILVFILCLYPTLFWGQIIIDYNIINNNPIKEIKNYERNFRGIKNPKEKNLVLYKTAYAYRQLNDELNMRLFLNKAEKQLNEVADPEFKSVMLSKIAFEYSGEMYYFKAINLINRAFKESDDIKNTDNSHYAKAYAYNKLGLIEHYRKNYYKTIQFLPYFLKHFNKQSPQARKKNKRLLLIGYINFGDAYMQNGDFERAEKLFLKSESFMDDKYKDTEAVIYLNLMELNFREKRYYKSIYYADLGLQKIPGEGFLLEKELAYRITSECYQQLQDAKRQQFFTIKHDSIKNILAQREKEIIKRNSDTEKEIKQKSKLQTWYFRLLVCIVITSALGYFYLRKRQKKKKQLALSSKKVSEKSKTKDPESKNVKVPVNIEQDLLKKLERFEKSNKYTNPKMSVAILAGLLETNVQYLSEIINKNKGKNFNAYINELRIQYIIEQIKNNKQLRTYKIAYLAKSAGFISHSTFSKVFKLHTGVLPSEYIKNVQEES